MKTTIRRMGNSQGVIIPKPLLAQVGLSDEAEMSVENNSIVLRKPTRAVRDGWSQASQRVAAAGDDVLELQNFANDGDAALQW